MPSINTTLITYQTTVQRKDDVGVKEYNWLPHVDIETHMIEKKNGLFSFALKVVNGEIKDFILMDNDKYHQPEIP
jgi:hypothetical protein